MGNSKTHSENVEKHFVDAEGRDCQRTNEAGRMSLDVEAADSLLGWQGLGT